MGYTYHVRRSSANGQYYWHLTAGNGEHVASSAETYVRKQSCLEGLTLFKRTAPTAPINDRTTGTMRRVATFEYELYEDSRGEFRWRFQAGNNGIIATSGEGYVLKQGCLAAIERVKRNAGNAPVVDHTKTAASLF